MKYALTLLMLVGGVAVLQQNDATTRENREEQIVQAVGRFIGLPDARIEVEKIERDRPSRLPWCTEWSFAAFEPAAETPSKTGRVYFDEEMGAVCGLSVSSGPEGLPPPIEADRNHPPDEVRDIAERIVAEFTPFDVNRLQEEFAGLLGGDRMWTFAWKEPTADPRVTTGGSVLVSIYARTHQPRLYSLYVPTQTHTAADIAVTHEEARRTATVLAPEGWETGAEGRLVLSSSKPGANRGPVWIFTLLREGQAPEAVVIDAMTGEHIP